MVMLKLISLFFYFAGRLVEAATYMSDDDILIKIQNTDCVAAEVRYHFCCWRNYVHNYERKLADGAKSQQRFV